MARANLGTLSVRISSDAGQLLSDLQGVVKALRDIREEAERDNAALQEAISKRNALDKKREAALAKERRLRDEAKTAEERARAAESAAVAQFDASLNRRREALRQLREEASKARAVVNAADRDPATGRVSGRDPSTGQFISRERLAQEQNRLASLKAQINETNASYQADKRGRDAFLAAQAQIRVDFVRAANDNVREQESLRKSFQAQRRIADQTVDQLRQQQGALVSILGGGGDGGGGGGGAAASFTAMAGAVVELGEVVRRSSTAVKRFADGVEGMVTAAKQLAEITKTAAAGFVGTAGGGGGGGTKKDTKALASKGVPVIAFTQEELQENSRLQRLKSDALAETKRLEAEIAKTNKQISAVQAAMGGVGPPELLRLLDDLETRLKAVTLAAEEAGAASAKIVATASARPRVTLTDGDVPETLPDSVKSLTDLLRRQFGDKFLQGERGRLLGRLGPLRADPALDQQITDLIAQLESLGQGDVTDPKAVQDAIRNAVASLTARAKQLERLETARRALASVATRVAQAELKAEVEGKLGRAARTQEQILTDLQTKIGFDPSTKIDAGDPALAGDRAGDALRRVRQATQALQRDLIAGNTTLVRQAERQAEKLENLRATLARAGTPAAEIEALSKDEALLRGAARRAQDQISRIISQINRNLGKLLGENLKRAEAIITQKLGPAGLRSSTASVSELEGVAAEVGQIVTATRPSREVTVRTRLEEALANRAAARGIGVEQQRIFEGAARETAQFNKQFQGLLGLVREGNIITRLFGNIAHGVANAAAVLIRFQVASRLTFGSFAALGNAVRFVADLNDSLAKLQAIAGATSEEMVALEAAARNVGKTTSVSALEAVEALTILAQAGLNANESMNALDAVVQLSVGGVASLDASAKLLTSTMQAFNIGTEQAINLADLFLQAVNRSKLTVEGLNTAFNFAGQTAAAAGLSVEELIASFGALSNAGVAVSTQGTAVRQTIASLIEPTAKSEKVFARLGLTFDELNPLSNDWITILQRLRDSGFGAAEAFEAFERRTASGVIALVQGVDEIEELNTALQEGGAAGKAFGARQESLSQQSARLANNLRELVVVFSRDLQPAVSATLKGFQFLVDLVQKYSTVVQGAAAATTALAVGGLARNLLTGTRGPFTSFADNKPEAERFAALRFAREALPQGVQFGQSYGPLAGIRSEADARRALGIAGVSSARFAFKEAYDAKLTAVVTKQFGALRASMDTTIPVLARFRAGLAGFGAAFADAGKGLILGLLNPINLVLIGAGAAFAFYARRQGIIRDLRQDLQRAGDIATRNAQEGQRLADTYERTTKALGGLKEGTESFVQAQLSQSKAATGLLIRFASLRDAYDQERRRFVIDAAEIERRIEAETTDRFKAELFERSRAYFEQRQQIREKSLTEIAAESGLSGARGLSPLLASAARQIQLSDLDAQSRVVDETLRRQSEVFDRTISKVAALRREAQLVVTDLVRDAKPADAAAFVVGTALPAQIEEIGKAFKVPRENLLGFTKIMQTAFLDGGVQVDDLKKAIRDFSGTVEETAADTNTLKVLIGDTEGVVVTFRNVVDNSDAAMAKFAVSTREAADKLKELRVAIEDANNALTYAQALFAKGLSLDVALRLGGLEQIKNRIAELGDPAGRLLDILAEAGVTTPGEQSVGEPLDAGTPEGLLRLAAESSSQIPEAQRAAYTQARQDLQAILALQSDITKEERSQVEAGLQRREARKEERLDLAAQERILDAQKRGGADAAARQRVEEAFQKRKREIERTAQAAIESARTTTGTTGIDVDEAAARANKEAERAIKLAERQRDIELETLKINQAQKDAKKAPKERAEDTARILELEGKFIEAAAIRIQGARKLSVERALEIEELLKINLTEKERASLVTAVGKQLEHDLRVLQDTLDLEERRLSILDQMRNEELKRQELLDESGRSGRGDAFLRARREAQAIQNQILVQTAQIEQQEGAIAQRKATQRAAEKELDKLRRSGAAHNDDAVVAARNQAAASEQQVRELERTLPLEESKLETLELQLETMRKVGEVDISFGDAGQRAIEELIDGLRTGDFDKIFENLGDNIFEEIKRGLAQSLTEKLEFDRVFRLNFLTLGQEAGANLEGGIGGALKRLASAVLPQFFDQAASGATDAFGQIIPGAGQAAAGAAGQFVGPAPGGFNAGVSALNQPGFQPNQAGLADVTKTVQGLGSSLGGLLSGALASITAIITAVTSITADFKSIDDETRKLKRLTPGDPSAQRIRDTSRVLGGVAIGAGIGVGAAAGTAIAPGVGTIVGAAVGGITASIVNKAIAESVSKGIREGLGGDLRDQETFNKEVAGSSKIKTLTAIFAILNPIGGILDLAAGAENNPILGAFLPDIEDIFDKMLQELLKPVIPGFQAGLKRQLGEGLAPAARERADLFRGEDSELRSDARILAQLALGAVGGLPGNADRLDRAFRLIANNVALAGKNAAEMEELIFRMVRAVSDGNFLRALRNVSESFGSGARGAKALTLTAEAFARTPGFRALGEAGTREIGAELIAVGATRRGPVFREARKSAREIATSAGGALFSGPDFTEGLQSFAATLRDSVRDAVSEGLIKAFITQGPVGAALTGFLGNINKFLRKVTRGALEDAEFERELDRIVGRGGERLAQQISRLKPFLEDIYKIIKEATDDLTEVLERLSPAQTTRERQGLFEQIVGIFSGAVGRIQSAINDLFTGRNRLITKIADTGEEDAAIPQEVIDNLRNNIGVQQSLFDQLGSQFGPQERIGFLQGIESAIDEFLSTTVDNIKRTFEPMIAQAKAAREVFESTRAQLLALRAGGAGGRSPTERLAVVQEEIAKQRAILLGGGTPEEQLEAARKLQGLFAQQLEIGRETLDTTGPAFAALEHATDVGLQEVANITQAMGANLESLEAEMRDAIKEAHKDAKDYYTYVDENLKPALDENFVTQLTALGNLQRALEEALGETGPLHVLFATLLGASKTTLEEILAKLGGVSTGGGPSVIPTEPLPAQPTFPVPTAAGDALKAEARRALREGQKLAGGDIERLAVSEVGFARADILQAIRSIIVTNLVGFTTSDKYPDVPRASVQQATYMDRIRKVLDQEFGATLGVNDLAIFAKFLRKDLSAIEGGTYAETPDSLGNRYFIQSVNENLMVDKFWEAIRRATAVKLQVGGIVRGETSAILHPNEAVIPLNERGLGFMVSALQRALASRESELTNFARLAAGGRAGGDSFSVVIEAGAMQFAVPNEATARTLPKTVVDAIVKEVRYGRIGRAAMERVRRAG